MSTRHALIFAFLLSDVVLFVVLRAWQADHPSDDRTGGSTRKPRTTIYDPQPEEK